MPRPVNLPKNIKEVIELPGKLYKSADDIVRESNSRLQSVTNLINSSQQVFDRIKPFMPPNNGATPAHWDDVASDSWGSVPDGGVVAAIGSAAAAGRALSTAYATDLHPAICSRIAAIDPVTGYIADARALVLTTDDMDLIRDEITAFRDAIEPISEL